MSQYLQSIYFTQPEWSSASAMKWLHKNGIPPTIKPFDKVGNELHYQITEPVYKHYKTEKRGVHGIRDKKGFLHGRTVYLVVGY